MIELLNALGNDHRFKVSYKESQVIRQAIGATKSEEVHLHLAIEPKPATFTELGIDWFREKDPGKKEQRVQKFWRGLITQAVKTHAPDAEPAWQFQHFPTKICITLGAVMKMSQQEAQAFITAAKARGIPCH